MGVSSSVSTILQALILFGAIGAGVLSRYQVRMVAGDPGGDVVELGEAR
jgi:ABC-type uncharacterized transport system permease subunit